MKRCMALILSAVMMATLAPNVSAYAANDKISVELDGTAIEFDVAPEVIDGRTMVPLRKIFEEIGALVKWDSETQTISARKNSKTVTLQIDSKTLTIDKGDTDANGNPVVETVTLEVPAQIVSGRTLVPARAISESFGLDVNWDMENQKVIISSDDDEDDSWKENTGTLDLTNMTFDGEGIEFEGNQIFITAGGDYTVTGKLSDGNITISAKEKVKLRLEGVSLTSAEGPCIYVEDADKAYITLVEDTKNYLIAEDSEDGAIYAKDNLEIKGKGTLTITSDAGHGIKASDNLNIENGTIVIDAFGDGMHINDTFKMTGGTVDIAAVGDGIDSESIVNISGGKINIETNGVPVTTEAAITTVDTGRGMKQETGELDFEKSSKGINAEWMMRVSGGSINIDSASHAVHCADEMEILGGEFTLSSKYEKGISAHGDLTISNGETVIDVVKSTEGIESKNILTINDGVITVVSSDDALNATGGNTGTVAGAGQMSGTKAETGMMQKKEMYSDGTSSQTAERPAGMNGSRKNRQMAEAQDGNVPPEKPEGDFAMGGKMPVMSDGQMNMGSMGQKEDTNINMGGMGRNLKDCLVINGGEIELYAGDDCLDSNGNLIINGGMIKATKSNGSFSGAEGILDPDGQTTISDKAVLILASGKGGNVKLSQNTIMVYCDTTHAAKEKITVKKSTGAVVYDYTPNGSYKVVLVASDSLEIGETYTVTIGSESHTVTLTEQSTVVGTQSAQNAVGNRMMQ